MDTYPDLPENMGALLDGLCESRPDDLAWVFFERDLEVSFRELRDTVNRAANALSEAGVSKGTHVAIMSGNSLKYCSCWLALARIGAVQISVNARYTSHELAYVLDDSDAEIFICDQNSIEVARRLETWPARLSLDEVIVFDVQSPVVGRAWSALIDGKSSEFVPAQDVGLDDLLNIQYTSGTTGFPKGCMLPQRFWLHSAAVLRDELNFQLKRVIYNQNFFYMDGPFLTSVCLLAGATLYIADKPSAAKFMGWVRRYKIQYCFFFEALYKLPEAADDADNSFELIQTFGFNRANHVDLERRYGTIAREAFGMTECGAALSMPESATDMVGSGSCGAPIATRKARLMDDAGKQVAQGDIGELWLKGPGMMQGYYNKPEATAETLRDGWLCTGDLCLRDDQGYYYIVGRKKDMIRRNAENIACREVEEAVRSMDAIVEAAAVAVPDERVGEEVKIYVQLQEGFTPEDVPPSAILAFCEQRLAVFKMPRYVEYRAAFPMTDSARVEKKKVIAESEDLRKDSYDRVDGVWR